MLDHESEDIDDLVEIAKEVAPRPSQEEVDAIEKIGDSAARAIAKWLMSSTSSVRWGSESYGLRRQIANAIEQGLWKLPEPNDGPR